MKIQYKILLIFVLVILILTNGCIKKEIPPEKYCKKDTDCVVNDCCSCSDELINRNFINCTGDNSLCPALACNTLTNKGIAIPKCIKNECSLVIKKPVSYIFYKIREK